MGEGLSSMVGVLLAGLAAVLFAAAAVMQQRGARAQARLVRPGRPRAARSLAFLMVGSPVWLAGSVVDGVGFATHATALHLGSLAAVQPVLTLTLPVSLVLTGARGRGRLSGRDWAGVVLLCAAVVAFLAVAAPSQGSARARYVLALATVVSLGVVVGFAAGGRVAGPTGRALLWGSSAAVAFGLTAALTKAATADLAAGGVAGMFTDWPVWVMLLAGLAGLALEQGAFAAGSLAAAMLPFTLVNPVAAVLLGLVAWHEQLSGDPATVFVAVLVALGLAAAGTAVVSGSQLLRPPGVRVR